MSRVFILFLIQSALFAHDSPEARKVADGGCKFFKVRTPERFLRPAAFSSDKKYIVGNKGERIHIKTGMILPGGGEGDVFLNNFNKAIRFSLSTGSNKVIASWVPFSEGSWSRSEEYSKTGQTFTFAHSHGGQQDWRVPILVVRDNSDFTAHELGRLDLSGNPTFVKVKVYQIPEKGEFGGIAVARMNVDRDLLITSRYLRERKDGFDREVVIEDLKSGKMLKKQRYKQENNLDEKVGFLGNRFVLMPSLKGKIEIIDVRKGSVVSTISSAELVQDGTHAASLDGKGRLTFLSIETGKPELVDTSTIQPTKIHSISGNGKSAIISNKKEEHFIVEAEKKRILRLPPRASDDWNRAVLDYDGKRIAYLGTSEELGVIEIGDACDLIPDPTSSRNPFEEILAQTNVEGSMFMRDKDGKSLAFPEYLIKQEKTLFFRCASSKDEKNEFIGIAHLYPGTEEKGMIPEKPHAVMYLDRKLKATNAEIDKLFEDKKAWERRRKFLSELVPYIPHIKKGNPPTWTGGNRPIPGPVAQKAITDLWNEDRMYFDEILDKDLMVAEAPMYSPVVTQLSDLAYGEIPLAKRRNGPTGFELSSRQLSIKFVRLTKDWWWVATIRGKGETIACGVFE